MTDKLMTVQELANFLNMPLSSVYDLSHKKKIPVIKIGQRCRFRLQEIEKWLADQSVKVGTENE